MAIGICGSFIGIMGASGILPGAKVGGSIAAIAVGMSFFALGAKAKKDGDDLLAGHPTATTIRDARKWNGRIAALAAKWERNGDTRRIFARLHACIAERVRSEAIAGSYSNGDRAVRLCTKFVRRFLAAQGAWDGFLGRPFVPSMWRFAFQQTDRLRKNPSWIERIEKPESVAAIYMAQAHILNDIPESLREVGCIPKQDFLAIMNSINDCGGDVVPGDAVAGALLNAVMGNEDTIVQWRMAAYANACEGGPDPRNTFTRLPPIAEFISKFQ